MSFLFEIVLIFKIIVVKIKLTQTFKKNTSNTNMFFYYKTKNVSKNKILATLR